VADPVDLNARRHQHSQKLKAKKATDLKQAFREAREAARPRGGGTGKLLKLYKTPKPPSKT
jgi:hypothetical protein